MLVACSICCSRNAELLCTSTFCCSPPSSFRSVAPYYVVGVYSLCFEPAAVGSMSSAGEWEFRAFVQWPGEDDSEGLTLLHRFFADFCCSKADLQEFRADDYSVSSVSDAWGAKRRKGKKWEAKYRVEYDPVWRLEKFIKKKYGNGEKLSAYASQVVAHLREYSLSSLSPPDTTNDAALAATAAALSGRNATLRLEKARKTFACSPASSASAAMEVCIVNVRGSDPLALMPLAWLSVSLEGPSSQGLVAELRGARMHSLWALLHYCGAGDAPPSSSPPPPSSSSAPSSSSSPSPLSTPRVVVGGYPTLCRALVQGASEAEAAANRAFLRGLWTLHAPPGCIGPRGGGGGGSEGEAEGGSGSGSGSSGGGGGSGEEAAGAVVCPPLESMPCVVL